MSESGPMAEAMSVLTDEWLRYLDVSSAGVLVWRIEERSQVFARAFCTLETSEEGVTPDLFLLVDEPFAGPGHADILIEQVLKTYENDREVLADEGLSLPPLPRPDTGGCPGLQQLLLDLVRAMPARPERVVVAAFPTAIADNDAWRQFIRDWVAAEPAHTQHLLVLDCPHNVRLDELVEELNPACFSRAPAVDMARFISETLEETAPEGSGKDFMRRFVDMNHAIGEGETERALGLGEQALEIAQGDGWFGARCAVYAALAGALEGEERFEECRAHHDSAIAEARAAVEAKDHTGAKLLAQCYVARGVHLMLREDYPMATQDFLEAAVRADVIQDGLLGVEAWRWASRCYQKQDQIDLALASGVKGLQSGRRVAPELRPSTMLPVLGARLMVLSEAQGAETQAAMNDFIVQLLGEGWMQEEGAA